MSYPSRLVPHRSDKVLTRINRNEVLCRWVDPELELKDESGQLTAEAIEEKRIFGYSTNKIPPSVPEDVRIDFHDAKFTQYWNEGDEPLVPTDNEFYDCGGSFFLFQIKDINAFSENYPYPADKKPNYKFYLKVSHKPLKANFSHFEFDFDFYELDGYKYAQVPPGKGQKR